jgi:hypothetical protein
MRKDPNVEISIRDAIVLGKGDANASVRALAHMVQRDDRLLRALVAPYIQGILFHWVKRVMQQLNLDTRIEKSKETKIEDISPDMMDRVVRELGSKIPVAKPAGPTGAPRTPDEAIRSIGVGPDDFPPPKATPKHQNAMRAVAKGFKFNPSR